MNAGTISFGYLALTYLSGALIFTSTINSIGAPNKQDNSLERKIFNVSITCGERVEAREAVLEILPCGNLIPSYYSTDTKLKHLLQGCSFHNRIRGGSALIVKRVVSNGTDSLGRVMFVDRSTDGILRMDGTISTRESPGNPYLVLDKVPDNCPKIQG